MIFLGTLSTLVSTILWFVREFSQPRDLLLTEQNPSHNLDPEPITPYPLPCDIVEVFKLCWIILFQSQSLSFFFLLIFFPVSHYPEPNI